MSQLITVLQIYCWQKHNMSYHEMHNTVKKYLMRVSIHWTSCKCYNTGITFVIPQHFQAFMQTVSTCLTVIGTKHMSEYMNTNTYKQTVSLSGFYHLHFTYCKYLRATVNGTQSRCCL